LFAAPKHNPDKGEFGHRERATSFPSPQIRDKQLFADKVAYDRALPQTIKHPRPFAYDI
jgi:hypothetical protein